MERWREEDPLKVTSDWAFRSALNKEESITYRCRSAQGP